MRVLSEFLSAEMLMLRRALSILSLLILVALANGAFATVIEQLIEVIDG